VATRLAALGVARSNMAVAGHSFNDLRVPTPPGVREPQNRRRDRVPAVRSLVLMALGPSHEGPNKTSRIACGVSCPWVPNYPGLTERDRAHVDFVKWVAGDIRYLLPLDL
jgi:hypothetical protein